MARQPIRSMCMGLEHGQNHEVMAPVLPLGIRRLPETKSMHPEGLAGETSPPAFIHAVPTNVVRHSAAVVFPESILSAFFAWPTQVSTVWQPILLNERTPVFLPTKVLDIVFQQDWQGLTWIDYPKDHDPLDDFWGIPGLFDDTEDKPWNA